VTARIILAYLLGRRDAILEVASSTASLWTGVLLVLLTAIARNYDQTHVSEKPFLWLFGPLLFSLVSGTWVFLVLNGAFLFKERFLPEGEQTSHWECWPQFMGLFWMTAPIAWLYAIPVERFCDSLTAAKANVTLLAIVSFWRVALMARVVQVVVNVPWWKALAAVSLAASIEVFVITVFGGTFARRITASMGGMRNSPEEEVLLGAMNFAFSHAMWIGVVSLIVLAVFPKLGGKVAWPEPVRGRVPTVWLTLLAALWVLAALQPQIQLARNVQVEGLVASRQYRAALDFLGSHQPDDFAPSRPLPPKAYEWEVFEHVPNLFAVLQPDDPEWVRRHCLTRLDEMLTHYQRYYYGARVWGQMTKDEQIVAMKDGIQRQPLAEKHYLWIIEGLKRIPEGRQWFLEHRVFLQALAEASQLPTENIFRKDGRAETWEALEVELEPLGHTNQARRIKLGHEPSPAKSTP
jgi:hypothetical protein